MTDLVNRLAIEIRVTEASGKVVRGSGFPVAPGLVMTCDHVVADAECIWVRWIEAKGCLWPSGATTKAFDDNDFVAANLKYSNKEMDVAILATPHSLSPLHFDIDPRPLSVDDGVHGVGFPAGTQDNEVTSENLKGVVQRTPCEATNGLIHIRLEDRARAPKDWRGASGAPVVARSHGRVIGVYCQTEERLADANRVSAIPASAIVADPRIQHILMHEAHDAEIARSTADLCRSRTKGTSSDIESFVALVKDALADNRTTRSRATSFIEQIVMHREKSGDEHAARSVLQLALELSRSGEPDALRTANIALRIAQIDAEKGNETGATEHLDLAENSIESLKSDEHREWANRKAVLLVMRSRVHSLLATSVKEHDYQRSLSLRGAAYDYLLDALSHLNSHKAMLTGDVEPFVANVELRAGFAADALGRYREAADHFKRARTSKIMTENRFQQLALKAWIGEAEASLFGGEPVKSRALWEEIAATPLADEQQRNGAKHNIRWIDEHVLEVTDWFESPAGSRICDDVASEPEGLRIEIAKQIAPLVDWFSEFPSKGDTSHAYSELIDVWGRGGFSRVVAAVRADALNAICVDATSIDEISLMARVFCPLYDTVIVSWKGKIHPDLGLIPMPDHLGPPGDFGGQGYMRTSDSIDGKEGWHAAIGWANFLPKEVSEFLAIEALTLMKSGRLVLLPAPLIGCTQRAVGWTDNLFTDFLLGGVVKTASSAVSPAASGDNNKDSRLLDLGAVSLPFMDGVSMSDLNRILDDSGDWLLPLRRAIHGSIGNNGLRFEHWDGLRPHISDVREAFRQLDRRWTELCSRQADQAGWNTARMESKFSAMRRSSDRHGSDPVADQLQAVIGSTNDDLGPWIPLWRMRRAGGKVNWTGNFDNTSTPPDQFARMQGFTSSVSQGWLYPGDGGPGMGASISLGA